ncbi:hypothetical protein AB0K02_27840 [Streptomyces sp. NPDC049597]|uniref:hypothetical protein n=1 Tax=Streptomyces sp. NPDC049597 TaxID=3155276 RepID=UPI003415C13B
MSYVGWRGGAARCALRDPGDIAASAPVTGRELELAEVLIGELTGIEVRELHDE